MKKYALAYIQSLFRLFGKNKADKPDPKSKATRKRLEAEIAQTRLDIAGKEGDPLPEEIIAAFDSCCINKDKESTGYKNW